MGMFGGNSGDKGKGKQKASPPKDKDNGKKKSSSSKDIDTSNKRTRPANSNSNSPPARPPQRRDTGEAPRGPNFLPGARSILSTPPPQDHGRGSPSIRPPQRQTTGGSSGSTQPTRPVNPPSRQGTGGSSRSSGESDRGQAQDCRVSLGLSLQVTSSGSTRQPACSCEHKD
jgi:hypothetical protein